jgi:hypothetical protein
MRLPPKLASLSSTISRDGLQTFEGSAVLLQKRCARLRDEALDTLHVLLAGPPLHATGDIDGIRSSAPDRLGDVIRI